MDTTPTPAAGSDQPTQTSPMGSPRSGLAVAGFVLSILLAPIGLVMSIVAYRRAKVGIGGHKGLARAGIIIGSGLTIGSILVIAYLSLIIGAFAFEAGGANHANEAQTDLNPFMTEIRQLGGTQTCGEGDNGYSIDNAQPWYVAYYDIADNANLTSSLKTFAAAQGYNLAPDPTATVANAQSDYLKGTKGSAALNLTISRDTSVQINCGSGASYGGEQPTGTGAIIELYMELPPNQR